MLASWTTYVQNKTGAYRHLLHPRLGTAGLPSRSLWIWVTVLREIGFNHNSRCENRGAFWVPLSAWELWLNPDFSHRKVHYSCKSILVKTFAIKSQRKQNGLFRRMTRPPPIPTPQTPNSNPFKANEIKTYPFLGKCMSPPPLWAYKWHFFHPLRRSRLGWGHMPLPYETPPSGAKILQESQMGVSTERPGLAREVFHGGLKTWVMVGCMQITMNP